MVTSKFRTQLLKIRLEASESQMELASEATGLGFWTWEPTTGAFTASPRSQSLLGMAPESAPSFDTFLAGIEPDDLIRVRRSFADALHFRQKLTVEFQVAVGTGVRRLQCAGQPHTSSLNSRQPALSGIVREVPETKPANPDLIATRLGSMAIRMESLRELDRATLVDRMKSDVSPSLTEVHHGLKMLSSSAAVPDNARATLTSLAARLETGMESIRSTIFELQPPGVKELGFTGALERYATEKAAVGGLALTLKLPANSLPLGPQSLEALYRVARAGIDNVVHHANAASMQVLAHADDAEICLRIIDDGVGISERDLLKDGTFSLFASSERISQAGGQLRIHGRPGEGTTLKASFTLRDKAVPARVA